ncbi:MAG: DNA-binding protein WhiA [Clostridia bacterium]|nr:DNA-binding protein WhiA [Clostridia bacterium]
MSFSGNTKASVSSLPPERDCCAAAQLRAMLSYAAAFDENGVKFITETPEVSDMFTSLLLVCADVVATPEIKENKSTVAYKTEITEKEDIEKLFALFGGEENIHKVNKHLFSCKKCAKAYIRGAFLSAGFVNSPEHNYHLEISTPHADLAVDTAVLLSEKIGMPKISARKASQIIYYRESAMVEDFLTFIGATKAALDIMNEQILREMRNQANRHSNFEVANLGKTLGVAIAQQEAIENLKANGKFEEMTPQMQELATLRAENCELSQKELGELMIPPISKSQVSKILAKIMKFYELYKDEKTKTQE